MIQSFASNLLIIQTNMCIFRKEKKFRKERKTGNSQKSIKDSKIDNNSFNKSENQSSLEEPNLVK